MTTLTGKVAIVTGASKGIGAGIAKLFAKSGASVVVNYSTSKDAANALVAEIKGSGGKAVAIQADFSKTADIQRLFEESKRAFGTLDILVNNAGVYAFAPAARRDGAGIPSRVHHERARRDHRDARGGEALRPERRQHHQHQLHRQRRLHAQLGDLRGVQERGRRRHARDLDRTRAEEDPRQQPRAGRHHHRRHRGAGLAGGGRQGRGRDDPVRPPGPCRKTSLAWRCSWPPTIRPG